MRLPDGSPATGVPVNIQILQTQEKKRSSTKERGEAVEVFNLSDATEITLEVGISLDSADTSHPVSSSRGPQSGYSDGRLGAII